MTVTTRQRHSRALFHWEAADGLDKYGGLITRTGQAATFDRGGTVGAASALDYNGRLYIPGYKTPRFHYDPSNPTLGPLLLLEGSRANVCLQSENFGTTWSAVGTPTRSAAAYTAGGVSMDLLGDDSAAVLKYYQISPTLTGDGVKGFSFFFKQGTSASTAFRLRDTVTAANRVLGVVTWAGSVPTVTITTGTALLTQTCFGMYRALIASTSATAANAHVLEFFPAADAGLGVGGTGDVYLGGVMLENAAFPSSYIPTTTAAVTRAADALSFPFSPVPQAMTVYADGIESGPLSAAISQRIAEIGDGSGARFILYRDPAGGGSASALFNNGAGSVTASAVASPAVTAGVRAEWRLAMSSAGALTVGISTASGAEVTNTGSAQALPAAWNALTLNVNKDGASSAGGFGFLALRSLKIAAGNLTMAQMRTL
jgi:hypothetical protein